MFPMIDINKLCIILRTIYQWKNAPRLITQQASDLIIDHAIWGLIAQNTPAPAIEVFGNRRTKIEHGI